MELIPHFIHFVSQILRSIFVVEHNSLCIQYDFDLSLMILLLRESIIFLFYEDENSDTETGGSFSMAITV